MSKYTEKEQKMIAKFLSNQLETLKKENRVGRCYYVSGDKDETLKATIEEVIMMLAEEIWK